MKDKIRRNLLKSVGAGRLKKSDIIRYATKFGKDKLVKETLQIMEDRGQISFQKLHTFRYPQGIFFFKYTNAFKHNYILDVDPNLDELDVMKKIKVHHNMLHYLCIQDVKKVLRKLGYMPREHVKYRLSPETRFSYWPDIVTGVVQRGKQKVNAYEIETGGMIKIEVISKLVKAVQLAKIDKITIVVAKKQLKYRYNKILKDIVFDDKVKKICHYYEGKYKVKKTLRSQLNKIEVVLYTEIRNKKVRI